MVRASGSERERADGSVLRRVATGVPPTRDPGGFLFAPSSRENRIGKCGAFVYCHSHMLLRVSRTSLLLGLLIAAADCGSESPTKPDSSLVAPSGIATLVVVSGDHQVGVVGNHLGPIEVRALSAAGKGVAERLVVWETERRRRLDAGGLAHDGCIRAWDSPLRVGSLGSPASNSLPFAHRPPPRWPPSSTRPPLPMRQAGSCHPTPPAIVAIRARACSDRLFGWRTYTTILCRASMCHSPSTRAAEL